MEIETTLQRKSCSLGVTRPRQDTHTLHTSEDCSLWADGLVPQQRLAPALTALYMFRCFHMSFCVVFTIDNATWPDNRACAGFRWCFSCCRQRQGDGQWQLPTKHSHVWWKKKSTVILPQCHARSSQTRMLEPNAPVITHAIKMYLFHRCKVGEDYRECKYSKGPHNRGVMPLVRLFSISSDHLLQSSVQSSALFPLSHNSSVIKYLGSVVRATRVNLQYNIRWGKKNVVNHGEGMEGEHRTEILHEYGQMFTILWLKEHMTMYLWTWARVSLLLMSVQLQVSWAGHKVQSSQTSNTLDSSASPTCHWARDRMGWKTGQVTILSDLQLPDRQKPRLPMVHSSSPAAYETPCTTG